MEWSRSHTLIRIETINKCKNNAIKRFIWIWDYVYGTARWPNIQTNLRENSNCSYNNNNTIPTFFVVSLSLLPFLVLSLYLRGLFSPHEYTHTHTQYVIEAQYPNVKIVYNPTSFIHWVFFFQFKFFIGLCISFWHQVFFSPLQ